MPLGVKQNRIEFSYLRAHNLLNHGTWLGKNSHPSYKKASFATERTMVGCCAQTHDPPFMKQTTKENARLKVFVGICYFLLGDADPDVRDNTGQTAMHIALREDSNLTVDLLLKHGCDVSIMDNLGQSALYIAIHSPCNRTLDMAKKLILAGDTDTFNVYL